MTAATAILPAVDNDPSLREALQSLTMAIGLRVATFGSTHRILTGSRPNAPGGSVANCHSPSISGILASASPHKIGDKSCNDPKLTIER
jgi:FixJ family two-component response regulator